ncbi:MAG: hypothetical protein SCK28_03995 [Bacillota bacterium]|nr:hypothetical protein [Bacillota bacterium]
MSTYSKEQLVSILVRGYQQQLEIYKEMLNIAVKQQQLCAAATFSEEQELASLTALIQARQELMRRLDQQNQVMDKVKKQLAERLGISEINISKLRELLVQNQEPTTSATGSDLVSQLDSVLGPVGSLLQQINELDKESQQQMNIKLKGVKKELDKIQAGKKAKELYQKPFMNQPDPVFLDKKK